MIFFQNSYRLKETFDKYIKLWHFDHHPQFTETDPNAVSVLNILLANYTLWHLEDRARDNSSDDSIIANIKREIDKQNQIRNDYIEKFDILLDSILKSIPITTISNIFNSETPGAIIDRLTILSLKIYHMREQTDREDASEEHIEKCKYRLNTLIMQRDDLLNAFDKLILDLFNGNKIHKVYYQFKMYNDPSLNPVLYSKNK